MTTTETDPLICGMHDWAYCDHMDGEPRVHVYGTCHKPPHGTSTPHAEAYRKDDGSIGLWAEFAGLPDPLPDDAERCDHARPGDPVYLDRTGLVVDCPPGPECDNTYKAEPCTLGPNHDGKVHRNSHGEWPMHLPFESPTAARDARIVERLLHHSSLGALCTCGERLPEDRLDTPRWFAEHVATQIAAVL